MAETGRSICMRIFDYTDYPRQLLIPEIVALHRRLVEGADCPGECPDINVGTLERVPGNFLMPE
jgi:hypothetical protein